MNIKSLVASVLVAAIGCGLVGCQSEEVSAAPMPVENISFSLAKGQTFSGAVTAAATRRRWLPQAQADGSIRCTLSQREHLVVVDVIPVGAQMFSIRQVKSNIPVRKYDQWVNNLTREIVFQASR